MTKDFQNKKVAILGLGIEGIASVEFLRKNGAEVWVLDRKSREGLDQNILTHAEGLGSHFILGEKYLDDLSQFDLIVRSPGVKRLTRELLDVEKKGVTITSQTKIFFDLCPAPIIGVTGTKGKGTTATLLYEMLKQAGKDVYLGGNIGLPPLTFLDKLTSQSVVVLELSSFQLQDLHKSPHIAVMLMVTSEHLNYHADMQEYIDAKRNILRFQTSDDFAILNRDYPATNESDIHTEGKVFFASSERETDDGCFKREDALWMRMNGGEKKVVNIKDIFLPGAHNVENAAAAAMAARLAGVEIEVIAAVLKQFKGLEHRLELVREVEGVKYYNDSFSTVPESSIAAIQAFKSPEILILGGSSKGSDFTELCGVITQAENIKAIIGIGDEWWEIKSQISNLKPQVLLVEGATNMHQIVQAANKISKPGDVVLLSPGCASFGMFKNYKERGEQFKKEVLKITG